MKFLFAMTATALMATAAPAQEAPAGKESKEAAKGGPNEVICKKMPPPAGTRLRARKECRTKAEWDALAAQTRDALRDGARQGTSGQ